MGRTYFAGAKTADEECFAYAGKHQYKPNGTLTEGGNKAWTHEVHMEAKRLYITGEARTLKQVAKKSGGNFQKIRVTARHEKWVELKKKFEVQHAMWLAIPASLRDPDWIHAFIQPGVLPDKFTGEWYRMVNEKYLAQAERLTKDIEHIDVILDGDLPTEERTQLLKTKCVLLDEIRHILGIPKVKAIDRNIKQLKDTTPLYELPAEITEGLPVEPKNPGVHDHLDPGTDPLVPEPLGDHSTEAEQGTP